MESVAKHLSAVDCPIVELILLLNHETSLFNLDFIGFAKLIETFVYQVYIVLSTNCVLKLFGHLLLFFRLNVDKIIFGWDNLFFRLILRVYNFFCPLWLDSLEAFPGLLFDQLFILGLKES